MRVHMTLLAKPNNLGWTQNPESWCVTSVMALNPYAAGSKQVLACLPQSHLHCCLVKTLCSSTLWDLLGESKKVMGLFHREYQVCNC